jgi:DNA polymerase elongation subunit (family B)
VIPNACVLDAETTSINGVADYNDMIGRPPARTKDPEKIAEWIENARAKQLQFSAVDVDLARIVCLVWTFNGTKLNGGTAANEDEEKALIERFWKETRPGKTYVGFNILDFDVPLLIRRSQYLDVSYPALDVSKWRHTGIMDLMQFLAWDGKINYRSLAFYLRRFGIKPRMEDPCTGADIPGLVALKNWDYIKRHCAADVYNEWDLAKRLGLIEEPLLPTEATVF